MSVFREKSLERISSPEDLDSYLRVSNPPMWIGLLSAVLLLVGALVWGIFGTMESTVKSVTVCRDGEAVCYVSDANYDRVQPDNEVRVGQVTAHITSAEKEAVRAETVLNDYAMHLSDLDEGEFVHALTLDAAPDADGSYASTVVVERIAAIRFLWN